MPQWLVSGHPTPTTMPAGHNGKINLRYCWHSNNAAEVKSHVSTKKPKQQSWLRTEFEKALDSLRARAFVAFFSLISLFIFFPRFLFFSLAHIKAWKAAKQNAHTWPTAQHNKCLIVLAALVKPTKLLRLQEKTVKKTKKKLKSWRIQKFCKKKIQHKSTQHNRGKRATSHVLTRPKAAAQEKSDKSAKG